MTKIWGCFLFTGFFGFGKGLARKPKLQVDAEDAPVVEAAKVEL